MSSKILATVGFGLVAMTMVACTANVDGTDKDGNSGWGPKSESTDPTPGPGPKPAPTNPTPNPQPSGGGGTGQCSVNGQASACSTCVAKSCCNELVACQNSQQCSGLYSCVSQCGQGDESCTQQCLQQYPQGREPLVAAFSCMDTKCGSACGGGSTNTGSSGNDG